jgi:hypothetical protein
MQVMKMAGALVAGTMMLGLAVSAGQSAETRKLQDAAGGAAKSIRVPCCKCVDGNKQYINFHTGSAAWTVKKPGAAAFTPVVNSTNPGWAPMAPANWVGAPGNPTAAGVYTYEIRFDVPRCMIAGGVSIAGKFGGDNRAKLFLDGTQIATSSGFNAAGLANFTKTGIGAGSHVIRVEVTNDGNVTALALQGTITVACPKDPNAVARNGTGGNQLASDCSSCATTRS